LNINNDGITDVDIQSKYDLVVESIKLLLTTSSLLLMSTRFDLTYDIIEAIKVLPPSHVTIDLSQYLHQSLQQGNYFKSMSRHYYYYYSAGFCYQP
jgi:hypothetical protein